MNYSKNESKTERSFLFRTKKWEVFLVILLALLLASCGPSPEEQTATAVALTAAAVTDTPTPIPTSTPTPTPTPIPYDLSILVADEDGVPIMDATVKLADVGEVGTQISDAVGQVSWDNLPGESVNISISAQGYFPIDLSKTIERGPNELAIVLEQDPYGLLPSKACAPGEKLVYVEDFQDGEAEGWPEIELQAQDWSLGPDPNTAEDIVLSRPAAIEGSAVYSDQEFGNSVWRIRFKPIGLPIYFFNWFWSFGGYAVDGTDVEWSAYQIWVHPPDVRVFRAQQPISTITLRDTKRSLESDVWHQLEVSIYNGKLEVWIDGAMFLTYNDPKPLPGGTMIFGAGLGEPLDPESIVYYNNISVCELTAPFTPMTTPEPNP